MRTTLDLDEDVLEAVKEIAEVKGQTAGKVTSDLVRKALQPKRIVKVRNGVPLLPSRPGQRLITNAFVQKILNDEA
jgi:hypothetical protein